MQNVRQEEKKKRKSIILSKSKGFIMQIGNRVCYKHDSQWKVFNVEEVDR